MANDELQRACDFSTVTRSALLARETPVTDLLKSLLVRPDTGSQAVLDSFVESYAGMTRGAAFTEDGYQAMRAIYIATRGAIDDDVERKIAEIFPPPAAADVISPLLGAYEAGKIASIVEKLRQDGHHQFDRLLPEEYVARLKQNLAAIPMQDEWGGNWMSMG